MTLAKDGVVFDTEGVRGTLEAPVTDVDGDGRAYVDGARRDEEETDRGGRASHAAPRN